MATCYRHPSRETGVSCSNCGNPICPDCMTATPVGMRCPDCARQKTPTRSLQSIAVEPIATYVLIALNVAVFVGARSSVQAQNDLILFGPAVADGDYWRLITSGFLHVEITHIAAEHAVAVLARADDRAGARARALRRDLPRRRCWAARWA